MCFRLVVLSCPLCFLCGVSQSQDYTDGFFLGESYPGESYQPTEPVFDDAIEYVPQSDWLDGGEPGRLEDLAEAPDLGFPLAAELDVDSAPRLVIMTNDDVRAMVEAGFGEAVIRATMNANPAEFDVSPKALVALKNAGVPETLIEAMLVAEMARSRGDPVFAFDDLLDEEPPEEPPARETTPASLELPEDALRPVPTAKPAGVALVEPGPHAWVATAEGRELLTRAIAQVAFVDSRRKGSAALKTLQGLSTHRAMSFASPALAVASEVGGWFRSDDPITTAVWALPGNTALQTLSLPAELRIHFEGIPGINPDQYRPVVVRLVPTIDNYRLVGAAKTRLSELDRGMPTEEIVQEPVAVDVTPLGRGQYRIALEVGFASGEYALVLRPTEGRSRKRDSLSSLGELLGSGDANLLYVAWDFSVE